MRQEKLLSGNSTRARGGAGLSHGPPTLLLLPAQQRPESLDHVTAERLSQVGGVPPNPEFGPARAGNPHLTPQRWLTRAPRDSELTLLLRSLIKRLPLLLPEVDLDLPIQMRPPSVFFFYTAATRRVELGRPRRGGPVSSCGKREEMF